MTPCTTVCSYRINILSFWKSLAPSCVVASVAVLSAPVAPAGAQTGNTVSEFAKLLASDGASQDQFGVSVAISGATAIVGAFGDDSNGSLSGSAYIFVKGTDGAWTQQAKLLPVDAMAGDSFGISVAISGDFAVVGAFGHGDNGLLSGAAYVFFRDFHDTFDWTQVAKLLPSDGAEVDIFGNRVAISGDTVIVGAAGHDDLGSNSGAAYVFVRDTHRGWVQQAKLLASDGAAGDFFGGAVAISGATAIVAAPRDDVACPNNVHCDSGSAYVFMRDVTGVWTQQAKLAAGGAQDQFGSALAMSGNSAIVGAVSSTALDAHNIHSEAYIFNRSSSGVWTQQIRLLSPTAGFSFNEDGFGGSVAISGARAVVGAIDNFTGTEAGSAYVFARDATGGWALQDQLLASDGAPGDQFGVGVALDADTAFVGAPNRGDLGLNSGAAYLFDLPASPSTADLNGDGVVNGADLAIVLSVWGTDGSGTAADLNNDGIVNGADLAALLANWG